MMWPRTISRTFIVAAGLATLLLSAVERTLNDLYFAVRVDDIAVSTTLVIKAALLAVAGTLASALPGAVEAARSPPATVVRRSTLETKTDAREPALLGLCAVLTLMTPVLLWLPDGGLVAGYAALFAVVGAGLSGLVAAMQERIVSVREARFEAHCLVPAVGDGCECLVHEVSSCE